MAAFKFKVKTDNVGSSNDDQFYLPLRYGYSYNFTISGAFTGSPLSITTSSSWGSTLTFPGGAGEYELSIDEDSVGGFPTIYFNNGSDKLKIIDITQWGDNKWLSLYSSFYGCSELVISATDESTLDIGSVDSSSGAFRNCSGLTSFPLIDTSSFTSLYSTWQGCSGLTSFPAIDTSSCTILDSTWEGCSGLTSFPLIDTSSCTDMNRAWYNCSGLTSFPLIDTSSCIYLDSTWDGCSGLTSFPLINTSSCTSFGGTWSDCTGLTSFPLIDTSSITFLGGTWYGCSGLTSFPLIDTSSCTELNVTWKECSGLTSFPAIDTSSCTKLISTWQECPGLTSFPLIDTSICERLYFTWDGCSSLSSFPQINTPVCTIMEGAWRNCSSLTSFPSLDFSSCRNYNFTWYRCSGLTSFPSVDFPPLSTFGQAWRECGTIDNFGDCTFENTYDLNYAFYGTSIGTLGYSKILKHLSEDTVTTYQIFYIKDTYYDTYQSYRDELVSRGWKVVDLGPLTLSADFYGSPLFSYDSTSVTFVDESVGDPIQWLWDFGDGGTSSLQNPTHQYSSPGSYAVTLTVYNEVTNSTTIKNDYITVASIAPLWNFGDGDTSTEDNPVHVYTNQGSYTVTLTSAGQSTTKYNYINVIARYIPTSLTAEEYGGGFTRSSGPSLIFD